MKTGKERMLAAYEEGSQDDIPNRIFYTDAALSMGHFWGEIQGDTPWWMLYTFGTRNDPDFSKRLKVEENIAKALDLDCLWILGLCGSSEWRKNQAIISSHRGDYAVNVMPTKWGEPSTWRRSVLLEKVPQHSYHRPSMDSTKPLIDMTDLIQTKEDIEYYVNVTKAEELIEEGRLDWLEAAIEKFGDEYFIQTRVGPPLTATAGLLGSSNFLPMIIKKPKFVKQILEEQCCKCEEQIKAYGKILAGREGVSVYAWEWYCGTILSPKQWVTFGKPYYQRLINAAHQGGMKMGLRMGTVGMDWEEGLKEGLKMKPDHVHLEEDGMKGVRTDLAWQADLLKREGYQKDIALMGNINATNLIMSGSSEELEKEVKRQIDIGREYGKFIMSPGVLIAPETTFERLQEYVRLIRKYGKK
jgi:uroporphyrinogen-III decarboxylase